MNLYHVADPHRYDTFAAAGRRGTWRATREPAICRICGRTQEQRVSPLIIEWEPGSNRIGDFTWPGFNDEVVVTQRVREFLESTFCCVAFHPVEMQQHPKLIRPTRPNKRTKPRVWLPFDGPPLWDMKPTIECALDHERSGVSLIEICPGCDRPRWAKPTFEDRHLVLDTATWSGEDIFHVREYRGWIFCTERVKTAVEAQGFTNVRFALDGEIPAE